jgi:hypothetical protein
MEHERGAFKVNLQSLGFMALETGPRLNNRPIACRIFEPIARSNI